MKKTRKDPGPLAGPASLQEKKASRGRGSVAPDRRVIRSLAMCGRFNLTDPSDIVERFGFMDWSDKRPEPRFNIAPSQEILTIVQLPLHDPTVQMAIWGLKPFWLEK